MKFEIISGIANELGNRVFVIIIFYFLGPQSLGIYVVSEKITELINDSYDEGVSKIIVVTGKGLHSNVEKDPYKSKDLSILKHSIPDFIKNNNELIKKINEIRDADIEDGGGGSFYIFLKKKFKE